MDHQDGTAVRYTHACLQCTALPPVAHVLFLGALHIPSWGAASWGIGKRIHLAMVIQTTLASPAGRSW